MSGAGTLIEPFNSDDVFMRSRWVLQVFGRQSARHDDDKLLSRDPTRVYFTVVINVARFKNAFFFSTKKCRNCFVKRGGKTIFSFYSLRDVFLFSIPKRPKKKYCALAIIILVGGAQRR